MRRVLLQHVLLALAMLAGLGAGCNRGRVEDGSLAPPSDAPDWDPGLARVFDDTYTREPIHLVGRAPHDVLDQRLFVERLGLAHLVARVTVEQVWQRGRYAARPDQYLEVHIDEVLLGSLPSGAAERQLLPIRAEDPLPGALRGRRMLLFLRWAPGEEPPYHHHLVEGTEEVVAWVQGAVDAARKAGAITMGGKASKRAERRARRAERRRNRARRRRSKKDASEASGEGPPGTAPSEAGEGAS